MIGRKELFNELKKRIRLRECTHVKASSGSGKTTLLKYLENKRLGVYAEPRPLKQLVQALAGQSKGTINELKKMINAEESVLLVDDSSELTRQVKREIKKLINKGLVVISAGSKNPFDFPEIELKPLKQPEAVRLVKREVKNTELARVIVSEVGLYPGALMNAARKAKARKDLITINGFNDFKKSINASIKRKDLLNPAMLGIVSGVLISLRYLFYRMREFQKGYTVAMIAYALITLNRALKRK